MAGKPRRTPEEIEALKTAILALDGEHGGSNKAIAERLNEQGLTSLSGELWTGPQVGSFKQRYLAVPKTAKPTEDREEKTEPDASNMSVTDLPQTPSDTAEDEDEDTFLFPETTVDPATVESIIARVYIKHPEKGEAIAPDTSNMPTGDPEIDATNSQPETYDSHVTPTSAHALPDDLVTLLTEIHENGELAALLMWWRSTGKGGQLMDKLKRPRFVGKRVNTGLLVNEGLKNRAIARAKLENLSLSQLVELLMWRYVGEPADCVDHDV
jgi:hypothetical protein